MRKALALGTAVASVLVMVSAGAASAEETVVTAAVTPLSGGRTMAVAVAPALATPSSTGVTGAMTVEVTETNAVGVNPWSVTAKMKDASLVLKDTAGVTVDSIAGSNLSAGTGTVTQTTGLLTGQTTSSTTGTLDLAGTGVTLLKVSGEDTAATYSNVFTAVTPLSLTVPNGKKTGSYTGTLTVTLVQ